MAGWKHPKTTQEKRESYGVEVDPDLKEHSVRIRGGRLPTNLPEDRDDKPIAAPDDRSWKRYRRMQYRPAA